MDRLVAIRGDGARLYALADDPEMGYIAIGEYRFKPQRIASLVARGYWTPVVPEDRTRLSFASAIQKMWQKLRGSKSEEASAEELAKAREVSVREYTRRTRSGKIVTVRAHKRLVREVAERLEAKIRTGGVTYQPRYRKTPRQGYAVGIMPERCVTVPIEEFGVGTVKKFLADNADLWKDKRFHVGGWLDDEGTVYLDVSVVVDDADEALRLSLEHDQEAYYDFAAGQEVYVTRKAAHPRQGDPRPPRSDGRGDRGLRTGLVGQGDQEVFRERLREEIGKALSQRLVRKHHVSGYTRVSTRGLVYEVSDYERRDPGKKKEESWSSSRYIGQTHEGATVGGLQDTWSHLHAYPPEAQDYILNLLHEEFDFDIHESADRLLEVYKRALGHLSPDEVRAQANWYRDVNATIKKLGKDLGYSEEQVAGVMASISPQMSWSTLNRKTGKVSHPHLGFTKKILRAVADNPEIEITEDIADSILNADKSLSRRASNPLNLRAYNGIDPNFKPGTNLLGKHRLNDLPADVACLVSPQNLLSATGRDNTAAAIRIARGEDPAKVLSEGYKPKVKSFYMNLLDPDSDVVTVDSHMLRAMTGMDQAKIARLMRTKSFTPRRGSKNPWATKYENLGYALWADAVRLGALKAGVKPADFQSIVWLQWRLENPPKGKPDWTELVEIGAFGVRRGKRQPK